MQPSDYLTILNILVGFLGVLLVVFTFFEWRSLRVIKKDFAGLEKRLRAENYLAMKAAHRVIASYRVDDLETRISLLEAALSEYPEAFNGFNALGYAYLEKGDGPKALDAFRRAISIHPEDKAGYCDLALAYLKSGQEDLAIKYFREAVRIDPTTKDDLAKDERLMDLRGRILG